MSDFIGSIKFESLQSPKYYNYESDSINVLIEPNKENISNYIYENKEEFCKYLKENYTSCDGFISSYTNDPEEWLEGWHEDSHKVGSVLQFICRNEDMEEPMYFDDLHISNFYTI